MTVQLNKVGATEGGRLRVSGESTGDLVPVGDGFGIYPGSIKLYELESGGGQRATTVEGIDLSIDVEAVRQADVSGEAGTGGVSSVDEFRAAAIAQYSERHDVSHDEAETALVEAGIIDPRGGSSFAGWSHDRLVAEVADTVAGIGEKIAEGMTDRQLRGLLEGRE